MIWYIYTWFLSIVAFYRGVLGPSERGGEERGADVQRRGLVAGMVRAKPDPGDGQPADERVAATAATVKRQHRPRTRTSYNPMRVETPSSVIILRLIDFLSGARRGDTRASPSAVPRSHSETRTIRSRAGSRDAAEKRNERENRRERQEKYRGRRRRTSNGATPY